MKVSIITLESMPPQYEICLTPENDSDLITLLDLHTHILHRESEVKTESRRRGEEFKFRVRATRYEENV